MRVYTTQTQSLWLASWGFGLFLAIMAVFQSYNIISLESNLTDLVYMSTLFFSIGAGFGLSSLEKYERGLMNKWRYVWLLFILIGIVLIVGSTLAYLDVFDANKTATGVSWDILLIVSLPLFIYGLILFFTSMSDEGRESSWSLWPLYWLFLLIGLSLGVISSILFILSSGGQDAIIEGVDWQLFLAPAILFSLLGLIPTLYAAGQVPNLKDNLAKFSFLWIIISLVGISIYLVTFFEVLNLVPDSPDLIGGSGHREYGLILGLLFQVPGIALLLSGLSDSKSEVLKKGSILWIVLVVIGFALASYSSIVNTDTSTFALGTVLVIFGSGVMYKVVSIDYIPQPIGTGFAPRQDLASGLKGGSDTISGMPSGALNSEKVYVLNLENRGYDNTIQQVRNAGKSGKLSMNVVSALETQYRRKIDQNKQTLKSVKDEQKRSSRKSIFEEGLGITSRQDVPSQQPSASQPPTQPQMPSTPSGPPGSPPPAPTSPTSSSPSPSAPPGFGAPPSTPSPPGKPSMPPPPGSGPETKPSGPPSPPGMPPPPGSGASTGPPPMPSSPPSGPPGVTPPPSSTEGDVVGTARSTSIAELRGEMLKELRRLRDIFKEDEAP